MDISDFRKSIASLFAERTGSPLYGTFILSWLVWNWQPIYVTLFVSEDKIPGDRLSYILQNHTGVLNVVVWPAVSTVLLILVVPLIANGAFWISIRFDEWRRRERDIATD